MIHTPWDLEVNARYRMDEANAAAAHRGKLSLLPRPARRSSPRVRTGRALVALGLRLGAPAPAAPSPRPAVTVPIHFGRTLERRYAAPSGAIVSLPMARIGLSPVEDRWPA